MLDSEHDAGQEPAVANRTTDDGPAQKQSTTTAQEAATSDTADTGDEARPRRRAASRPAGPPASQTAKKSSATKTAAKKSSATKTAAKKTSAKTAAPGPGTGSDGAETPTDDTAGQSVDDAVAEPSAAKQGSAKRATTKRSTGTKSAAAAKSSTSASASASGTEAGQTSASTSSAKKSATTKSATNKSTATKKSAATKTSAQQATTQKTGAADDGESAQGTVDAPASPPNGGSPAAEQAETGETTRAGGDTKHTSHARGQPRGNRSQPQEEPAQTDPAIEAALESAWRQKKTEHTQPDPNQEAAGDTSGPKQPVDSPEGAGSAGPPVEATSKTGEQDQSDDQQGGGNARRRRRRGGRRRRREPGDHDADGEAGTDTSHNRTATPASGEDGTGDRTSNKGRDQAGSSSERTEEAPAQAEQNADDKSEDNSGDNNSGDNNSGDNGGRRRRRRRRRRGESSQGSSDDPNDVVTKVRDRRQGEQSDEVSGVDGSTRVEAKRIRRREGRDSGRRRAPILSEQEFLARRESVDRKMVIRQLEEYAQIAVLEDGILVEHYVDRADSSSLIGNVYLGRVQNVLPSMEAAFVDIGRGRNAVLYAGDLDWDGLGAQGEDRKVENVLKSGQSVLVQVTKDPIGAKGARLTHHISMPGRYVVYAPAGHVSGISRKLPEEERQRLKNILAGPVGDEASVIIRTAAEGASEDELTRDVDRLKAQWESIEKKVKTGQAPQVLYAEPDLTLRIVRDLFTEDFSELIIQGNGSMTDAYDSVDAYLNHVAPHLADRVQHWDTEASGDLFGSYRLDEQIAKALERKVFLPSGGSLIVDRTEAMTVIDVNTGKFTGNGGNLEATVASNNLEAAEEIARQLRLRDIGGIIVIDFIDMVLPNNRELLLRRLVESLGRDRTRHQVTEVTSLGLVQMTRKRIGSGLLEAFSSQCPHCHGRGVELHDMPVADKQLADGGARNDQNRGRGSNKRRSRSRSGQKKNADGRDDGANDRSDQENESDTGTQQDAGNDATSQETQPA